jgi:hypothetical protein
LASSQTLFDDFPRLDKGPSDRSESTFEYLNRSARSDVALIRDLLEDWFSRLPPNAQPELHARFRSADDRQYLGAFFELYLHQLFLRLGMTVERQTRPDFRIFKDNEPVFYLEAVLAAPSNADVSTEKIKNRIYDALNQRLNSPNFLIAIQRAKGASTIDPPIKPLIRLLEERLNSLDPDAVARQMEQGGWRALPFWTWQHEEWEISFRAIPKLPQMRGKPGVRPVGSYMKSGWVEPQEGIRGAIRKKATKYGELDLPYIIAVNALEEFVEQDAAVEALFGDECIVATPYRPKPNIAVVDRKVGSSFRLPVSSRRLGRLARHSAGTDADRLPGSFCSHALRLIGFGYRTSRAW